jgi:hypothetical protein
MMDLSKSYEFFKPENCKERIHIIGCGSVGSTVAELLARFGLTNITLYDFDIVEKHNIVNQMFASEDIGRPKVEAVADIICRINPEAKEHIKIAPEGYKNQRLSGYVFLCVDNIDLRREIATKYEGNTFIKAMFDFRTRLTDAQHYAADWSNSKMVTDLINSMDFTREEAAEATPMSACNVALSVAPTLRIICSYGVSNFINYVTKGEIKKLILIDAFNFTVNAF